MGILHSCAVQTGSHMYGNTARLAPRSATESQKYPASIIVKDGRVLIVLHYHLLINVSLPYVALVWKNKTSKGRYMRTNR